MTLNIHDMFKNKVEKNKVLYNDKTTWGENVTSAFNVIDKSSQRLGSFISSIL